MEETLVQKQSHVPTTPFEKDVDDFLVEHQFHSMYVDEQGNLICYFGNRYTMKDFIPNCEKVNIWKNLQERYAAGER